MSRKYTYRRKLPHKQWQDKVYFITFSTHHREVLIPRSRDIVLKACLRGIGKPFDLHAVVVMPDHVHLLLTPEADEKGTVSIPEIMQPIKSTSPHEINKYLGRKGRVWQEESFDRAMREVDNTRGRIDYIQGNPVRAVSYGMNIAGYGLRTMPSMKKHLLENREHGRGRPCLQPNCSDHPIVTSRLLSFSPYCRRKIPQAPARCG